MKTTEFVEIATSLGFEVFEENGLVRVCKETMFKGKGYVTIAEVYDNLYALHVVRSGMMTEELFDVLVEYADTDVEEREKPATTAEMMEKARRKFLMVGKAIHDANKAKKEDEQEALIQYLITGEIEDGFVTGGR